MKCNRWNMDQAEDSFTDDLSIFLALRIFFVIQAFVN
jgi:hypothetical protein